ncbi:MAG: DNA repair protein RecO [Gemmatimonadota bacterium]
MPAIETNAIILSTLRYGETSKIARLATREHGVVSAIAKGALRPKSRFGTALRLLSEGHAGLLLSRHSDLHTLISFDAVKVRTGIADQVERYAIATALSEMMIRFAPQDPHPASYDFLRDALDLLEVAPAEAIDVIGLRILWGMVDRLGFAPTLDRCVRDARVVDSESAVLFSTVDGGVLCASCEQGAEGPRLLGRDRRDLIELIEGGELPVLDAKHTLAHRRLLDRYVRHHLSESAQLPALTFWSTRAGAAS